MTEPENYYWQELYKTQQEAEALRDEVRAMKVKCEEMAATIAGTRARLLTALETLRRMHEGDL